MHLGVAIDVFAASVCEAGCTRRSSGYDAANDLRR